MEDPDWRRANLAGDFGIGVGDLGIVHQSYAQLRPVFLRAYAAADGNEGGEASGIAGGEFPGAESAHGEAGEIDTVAITVKFLERRFERGHSLGLHVGLAPDLPFSALRDHYDKRELGAMEANSVSDADIGLE